MRVHSESIRRFTEECKSTARMLLATLFRLRLGHQRFLIGDYSYPLTFRVFKHDHMLGQFQSQGAEIWINEIFLHYPERSSLLRDVIAHELLHYLTEIHYGPFISTPHGKEFKETAERYRIPDSICRATSNISIEFPEWKEFKNSEQKVHEKLQKLLTLAERGVEGEAEVALQKAQQWMEQHPEFFQSASQHTQEEDYYLFDSLTSFKRISAKYRFFAMILPFFNVEVLFESRGEGTHLIVFGKVAHVEVARYVLTFLDQEFQSLYSKEKKKNKALHRDSFYSGLARGIIKKLEQEKSAPLSQNKDQKALILLEGEKRREMFESAYPHLRSSRSQGRQFDSGSYQSGQKASHDFHVRPGLKKGEQHYLTL
jgi:predicted metal-dependent hydrolase